MAGMVLGIYFTDPEYIAVLDNTKFKTETIKYCRKNARYFKQNNPSVNLEKILTELENTRRIPPHPCIPPEIWRWIKPIWKKENIDPKPDHYGVPAGKIDQFWIDQYPKDFFDYVMAGEFVEETGKSIVRAVTNSDESTTRICLFKRLMLLLSKNRETGLFDYEHYFFHILEADGKWNIKGYEEETEPPEIIKITNLYPPNYRNKSGEWPKDGIDLYPKHGFGIKVCLRELVHIEGKNEYLTALEHMEKFFPREAKEVGLIQELESEPTLDLNDEELWLRATKGVKQI